MVGMVRFVLLKVLSDGEICFTESTIRISLWLVTTLVWGLCLSGEL